MTFSKLISRTIPCNWVHGGKKWSSRQGRPVSIIIDHHWGGVNGGIETLSNPSREASASYLILSDGTIIGQVPEEYRPWTSGGWEQDSRAITIEVQNSTGAPNWEISAAAWKALVALTVDIARRHKWGSVTKARIMGHRDYDATACPGPYLYPRLGQQATEAQKGLGGKAPAPAPKPTTGKKSNHEVAQEIIAGKGGWGNAPERYSRLAAAGYNANAVQAEVNQILLGQPKPTATKKRSVREVAQDIVNGKGGWGNAPGRYTKLAAAGYDANAVQAEVNRILLGKTSVPANNAAAIDALARRVIRGDFGNGPERQQRLGAQYAAVQARVNQLLG